MPSWEIPGAIREKTGEISLSNLAPALVGQAENLTYTVSPRSIQVRVRAPLSLHQDPAALAQRLVITLDVGWLEPGSHSLIPTVSGDELIEVVNIRPEEVRVKIAPNLQAP